MGETGVVVHQGSADEDADDGHHAGADQLLAHAERLQAQVEHQRRGDEEDQAADLAREAVLAEELEHDVAAAGHVGDQGPVAVGRHRDEDQPAAERAQVTPGEAAELVVAAGPQAGFGHVEHGDDAEEAGQGQAYQQRHVADLAGGVGHAQHAGADVGADDDRDRLERAQGMGLEARCVVVRFSHTHFLFPLSGRWSSVLRGQSKIR